MNARSVSSCENSIPRSYHTKLSKGQTSRNCFMLMTHWSSPHRQKEKQGKVASKRPCVSAHGYISIQLCSKVSPQRQRFFTDIYIWKNESHGVIIMVFVGRKPSASAWTRQLYYAFSSALPTSLFQPLLRQRMINLTSTYHPRTINLASTYQQRMINVSSAYHPRRITLHAKYMNVIAHTPPHPTPTVASTSPQRSIKVWST